jgi:hypothetical protein
VMKVSFMHNPETKCQSATWLSAKKPKAQKVSMQRSWVKTTPTAFLDTKDIIHLGICEGMNRP